MRNVCLMALLAFGFMLSTCSPSPTPTPIPTAEAVLERARDAMSRVQSYRFRGDLETISAEGVHKVPQTGEWAAPDRLHVRFEGVQWESGHPIEFIVLGERVFAGYSDATREAWQETQYLPPGVPRSSSIVPRLDDPVLVGDETVGDVAVYHVIGTSTPDVPKGTPASVRSYDVYVRKEDFLLQRLVVSTELGVSSEMMMVEGEKVVRQVQESLRVTYDFYDYNAPVTVDVPAVAYDPCAGGRDPERLLRCQRFSQRVYWLGQQLAVPGAPDLVLDTSYRTKGEEPISPGTRLVVVYSAVDSPHPGASVGFHQWFRPAWEEYVAQFTGYDPSTVPPGGPVNWWQHPCVEEEVYREASGAEVHLFRAHLPSLIYIYPMTPEEVARCHERPVGAVGAHVYFEKTVVEFSVQHSVSPAGPRATPKAVPPGATLPTPPARKTYPKLVLRGENPYNDVSTVRLIAASLRPYEGD